ncbi:MAG: OmpA family protein [Pikeienuella sp.]
MTKTAAQRVITRRINRVILTLWAALCLSLLPQNTTPGFAQAVAPEFGAPQGVVLARFDDRAFDAYDLPLGPYSSEDQPADRLEGRVREYIYQYAVDKTTLFAIREFGEALAAAGFETRYECVDRECGGFDFRFGIFVSRSPEMRVNIADFRFLSASNPERDRHVGVLVSRHSGALTAQVIEVEAASVTSTVTDEGTDDTAGVPRPRAKPNEARLFALARRLTEAGHAVLEGIDFKAGSAELTGNSDAALAQVARVMSIRTDISFLVVGHTDNHGELELNLKLSKSRAASVVAALVAIGIDPSRLEAHGLGFLAPRASNDTEDGRAQNRRVELAIR